MPVMQACTVHALHGGTCDPSTLHSVWMENGKQRTELLLCVWMKPGACITSQVAVLQVQVCVLRPLISNSAQSCKLVAQGLGCGCTRHWC